MPTQYGSEIQALTLPNPQDETTRRWRLERIKPRPTTPNLTPDLIECLADSLIAGTHKAHHVPFEPPLLEEYPDIFHPTPGRCLWTWDDLIHLNQVQDQPSLLDLAPLYHLAVRPADHPFPPRLAATSLGMTWAGLHRALNFIHPAGDYNDTHKTLTASVYPIPSNVPIGAIPMMPRISIPRNSRRTLLQHYALQQFDQSDEDDHPDNHPIAEAILSHPPVEVDLGPSLRSIWAEATERVQHYAKKAVSIEKANRRKPPQMYTNMTTIDPAPHLDEIINKFVNGPWDLSPLDRDVEPIRKVQAAMLWCMIQCAHSRSQARYFKAETLVPLSVLSGVPLSAFTQWGLERFKQTGHAFIPENVIEGCLMWVREHALGSRTHTQQARAETLADQLEDHLEELHTLRDTYDPTMQVNTSLCLGGGMPAWGVGFDEDED